MKEGNQLFFLECKTGCAIQNYQSTVYINEFE
jgi:hypothetical protein